jgi:hypothetical protein
VGTPFFEVGKRGGAIQNREERRMAKHGKYGAEKRKKELKRKKKQEEKLERKRMKKQGTPEGESPTVVEPGVQPPDTSS